MGDLLLGPHAPQKVAGAIEDFSLGVQRPADLLIEGTEVAKGVAEVGEDRQGVFVSEQGGLDEVHDGKSARDEYEVRTGNGATHGGRLHQGPHILGVADGEGGPELLEAYGIGCLSLPTLDLLVGIGRV